MIRAWKTIKAINKWEDANLPFVWGETDCCQFASFIVEEVTGKKFRFGEYGTASEAQSVMSELGDGRGLGAAVSRILGQDPVAFHHLPDSKDLNPGDPVLVKLPVGEHGLELLGVFTPGSAVAVNEASGLIQIPLKRITHGWRV